MKKVVVLGSGMVGRAIIEDLSRKYTVLAVDINSENLTKIRSNENIESLKIDLSNKNNIAKITRGSDLIIGTVPGFMGFQTLKTVIEAGKDIVDISFFPEDAFELDELAKKKDVTAVVDCGVAPGMSNLILGFHNSKMKVEDFACFVGGLPFKRELPYQYKAPFSPIDVIEEYIRPARFMENGKIVIKPALSEPELIEFEKVGTLEAFNTDGLRSLLKTMEIPNMNEKTMRYPGHIEYIKVMKETGFFQTDEIEVNGKKIRPIDLTTQLLIPKWKLEDNEPEFTVMKIIVSGQEDGKPQKYIYTLFDEFDQKTKTSSMARSTGYACTSVAELVLSGDFSKKGICPPEFIGIEQKCFEKVLEYQRRRGIDYQVREINN
ncbi:MAG: saccharopine dehydrogenase NADP-binding domain-containing protein [Candidatus Cloacimonetes bacterium]|nr:saccharopine dehydrogenase NADP-binding domain-containing protein [Candidatus Cloacimonadota bacterium]